MAEHFSLGMAVASLNGRRHGQIAQKLKDGLVSVRWSDGEREVIDGSLLLSRYTTQSVKF